MRLAHATSGCVPPSPRTACTLPPAGGHYHRGAARRVRCCPFATLVPRERERRAALLPAKARSLASRRPAPVRAPWTRESVSAAYHVVVATLTPRRAARRRSSTLSGSTLPGQVKKPVSVTPLLLRHAGALISFCLFRRGRPRLPEIFSYAFIARMIPHKQRTSSLTLFHTVVIA